VEEILQAASGSDSSSNSEGSSGSSDSGGGMTGGVIKESGSQNSIIIQIYNFIKNIFS
jgi:hypothetical protein